MDPNAALEALRAACKEPAAKDGKDVLLDKLTDMVYMFEALDEWIVNYGFLPEDWRKDND